MSKSPQINQLGALWVEFHRSSGSSKKKIMVDIRRIGTIMEMEHGTRLEFSQGGRICDLTEDYETVCRTLAEAALRYG